MSKAEKQHQARVRELGCIVMVPGHGRCCSPASIHHTGTGAGGRKDEMKVLPLCPYHHIGPEGIDGKQKGMCKRTWQEKYGSEEYLLQVVDDFLTFGNRDVA